MTPKAVAIVACRLLSVWFFVQAARDFVSAVASFTEYGSSPHFQSIRSIIHLCAMPVIGLGAGTILWLGAFVLADNMTRGVESSVANKTQIGIVGWQTVGLSLIGMFLCAQGLSFLCGYGGPMMFEVPYAFYGRFDAAETWQKIVASGAQFVVGLFLLFKAQKTIRVLDYLQRGGRDT